MMIVMTEGATEEQIQGVVDRIEKAGANAHISRGQFVTVIGAVGDADSRVHEAGLELADGVDHVVPIMKPYKLSSLQFKKGERSTLDVIPVDFVASGMLLATAQVYFRDTSSFLPYVNRIWLYLSPVLYYPEAVPQALRADDGDAVVYLGTFSKTIAAGLRVGWAVAIVNVAGSLMSLTMNRPEKKNALTNAMYGALADGLQAAQDNPALAAFIESQGNVKVAEADPDPVLRDMRNAEATRSPVEAAEAPVQIKSFS